MLLLWRPIHWWGHKIFHQFFVWKRCHHNLINHKNSSFNPSIKFSKMRKIFIFMWLMPIVTERPVELYSGSYSTKLDEVANETSIYFFFVPGTSKVRWSYFGCNQIVSAQYVSFKCWSACKFLKLYFSKTFWFDYIEDSKLNLCIIVKPIFVTNRCMYVHDFSFHLLF